VSYRGRGHAGSLSAHLWKSSGPEGGAEAIAAGLRARIFSHKRSPRAPAPTPVRASARAPAVSWARAASAGGGRAGSLTVASASA